MFVLNIGEIMFFWSRGRSHWKAEVEETGERTDRLTGPHLFCASRKAIEVSVDRIWAVYGGLGVGVEEIKACVFYLFVFLRTQSLAESIGHFRA